MLKRETSENANPPPNEGGRRTGHAPGLAKTDWEPRPQPILNMQPSLIMTKRKQCQPKALPKFPLSGREQGGKAMKKPISRIHKCFGKWGILPLLSLIVAGSLGAADEEVISLLDFGAVGDGIADDTEAIEKAVAYAHAGNRNANYTHQIFVPAGIYAHTGITLNSLRGVRFVGENTSDPTKLHPSCATWDHRDEPRSRSSLAAS